MVDGARQPERGCDVFDVGSIDRTWQSMDGLPVNRDGDGIEMTLLLRSCLCECAGLCVGKKIERHVSVQ